MSPYTYPGISAPEIIGNKIPEINFPERVSLIVSEIFGIKKTDLNGEYNGAQVLIPRHAVIYILKNHTKMPLIDIARYFNKKDHTTVYNSCRTIENLIFSDNSIKLKMQIIKNKLGLK
jgi:chromosomal replication initiator protein